MLKMNFHTKWVRRVMECVTSVRFHIRLEFKKIDEVRPKCGLRQGDPLSPYLFILVADVFSKMISAHINRGDLNGIKLAQGCPTLSYCLFADDSIFFLRADSHNCLTFKSLLESYCEASGQRVNVEKSCIFMSKNSPDSVTEMVGHTLGFNITPSPGIYLGLPILWERSKVEALAFVRDKIGIKLQG